MTPQSNNQEYYKKMLELQDKLRKSEEERIRLEERFNRLEQDTRMRHEACINKLRMRYIEFLEEQRLRDERNSKLLGALDRVDSSLALMTAKTDRLYSLRKEYESSALQAYVSRRPTPSLPPDSGIVSHNELRRLGKYQISPRFPSAPITPLSVYASRRHPSTLPRSALSYPQRPTLDQDNFSPKSRDFDIFQPKLHFEDQPKAPPIDSLKTSRYFPKEPSSPFQYPEVIKSLRSSKFPSMLPSPNFEDERTGNMVENELERYITKIRSLHGDHTTEEVDHEQNTSGDLLNVSLSDDGLDHLPREDRTKIPEEVDKVLAIAEDLASRTTKNATPEKVQDANLQNPNEFDTQLDKPESDVQDLGRNEPQVEQVAPGPPADVLDTSSIKPDQPSSKSETVPEQNMLNVAEETVSSYSAVEELESWRPEEHEVLIHQETVLEEPKSVAQTRDISKNDVIEEAKLVPADEENGKVEVQPEYATVEAEADKVQNAEVTYQEDYKMEGQETYQDPAVGYDYNNPESAQYADGQYQYDPNYNYDANGQIVEGGYPQEAGENYEQNYAMNPEYLGGSYLADPNAEYAAENYTQHDSQYGEGNYDSNAQYQEGQYAQEGQQGQYEDPNGQYHQNYLNNANPEYNAYPSNYEYYQSEDNPGYQAEGSENVEAQENPEQAQHSAEEPHVEQEDVVSEEESKKKKNKKKDVINSILDSETESSIEKNSSNTESDFNFN